MFPCLHFLNGSARKAARGEITALPLRSLPGRATPVGVSIVQRPAIAKMEWHWNGRNQ